LFATLLAFFSLGRLFPLALCPSSFRDSVLDAFLFALFLRSFSRASEAVKLSRFFSSRDTSWAYRISHGWVSCDGTKHSLLGYQSISLARQAHDFASQQISLLLKAIFLFSILMEEN